MRFYIQIIKADVVANNIQLELKSQTNKMQRAIDKTKETQ